ncbi:MAG: hypothetical protein R3A13_03300 [Bdellovibrionota bacterium]
MKICSMILDVGTLLIAELEALFPQNTFIFLARDMEYYYDIVEMLARDGIINGKKYVLLNVSRESLPCSNLELYLSKNICTSCHHVTIVDTGFNGNVIKGLIPHLDTHFVSSFLLCSDHKNIPFSYGALQVLGASPEHYSEKRKLIVEQKIEQLSHFNSKVIGYSIYGEEIFDKSNSLSDFHKKEAVDIMSGLVYYYHHMNYAKSLIKRFEAYKKLIKSISKTMQIPQIHLHINTDCLLDLTIWDKYIQFRSNNEKIPVGLLDFLRELEYRYRSQSCLVTFSGHEDSQRKLLDLLHGNDLFYTVRHWLKRSITRTHFYPDMEFTFNITDFSNDFQRCFYHFLYKADKNLNLTASNSDIFESLRSVLVFAGGSGFVKLILERASQFDFGVRFIPSAIDRLWGTLLEAQVK